MKKISTYWLLAAAMTLAGCASDNDIATEYAGDDNDAVTINATRAATSTSVSSTTLAEGETFCLVNETRQSLGRTNKYKAVYEVTSSGIVPEKSAEYVVWQTGKDKSGNEITQNSFRAVIPDDAPLSNFQLPLDQSTADKLKAADWQLASASPAVTAMQAKPTLSLNFEHQLTKIVITISENVKSDLASLSNLQILGSVTPLYSADVRTIQAIVEPATSTPNAHLLTFSDATGETYNISLPTSITSLDMGKQYNFTLTGGHDLLTISSVSVTDWTNADAIEIVNSAKKTSYVTFSAEQEQGFYITRYYGQDPSGFEGLEYSVGDGAWIAIPATGIQSPVLFGGDRGNLRLRGKNPNGTSLASGEYSCIVFTENSLVSCKGDIRTLLDYENYTTVSTANARFAGLFSHCRQLTSAPTLPATDLADHCYYAMFDGCTNLTSAPVLPATVLADGCYSLMFSNCINMTSAPALPAKVLADECYLSMFSNCFSLTSAPALPATVLANKCYSNMFYNCDNLTSAPALPATDLADYCYMSMFSNCRNLSSVSIGCDVTIDELKLSLYEWLDNAGTKASSRTLTVKNIDIYNTIYWCLPNNWQIGSENTTVLDENGNELE